MTYQLTIGSQVHVISEATAIKLTKGVPIPLEGLTIETKTSDSVELNRSSKKGTAFIKPI